MGRYCSYVNSAFLGTMDEDMLHLTGLTFRFVRAGMDLDLNFTWRQRPSRVVEGLLYSDMMVLMNLTRSGVRVRRQQ